MPLLTPVAAELAHLSGMEVDEIFQPLPSDEEGVISDDLEDAPLKPSKFVCGAQPVATGGNGGESSAALTIPPPERTTTSEPLNDPVTARPGCSAAALPGEDRNNMDRSDSAFGKIVVVQPIGSEEEVRRFVGRSLELTKLLDASLFGKAGIQDVRINFTKQRITVHVRDGTAMRGLLALNKLGPYTVQCSQPISHCEWKGVIGPIGVYTPDEELLAALREQNEVNITNVFRITKGKEKTPTLCMKLVFDSPVLPEYIHLNYQRLKVRRFFEKPRQCFQCQAYGHVATNCKGKTKCVVCAGNHSVRECPKEGTVKCANCGQSHTASFGGCLAAKNAQRVEKIRTTQGLTYSEAVRASRTIDPPAARPSTNAETNASANRPIAAHQTEIRSFADAGCQTISTVDQSTQMTGTPSVNDLLSCNYSARSSSSPNLLDGTHPDAKFCALMIKVLNALCNIPSVLSGDSKNQGQIVSTMVGEVYGTHVDAGMITKHLVRQKTTRPLSEVDSDSGSGTEQSPLESGAADQPKVNKDKEKPPHGKKKKGSNSPNTGRKSFTKS